MIDEYILKIPLIGDHATGKTTLVQRICVNEGRTNSNNNNNNNGDGGVEIGNTRPTVGVEFSSRVIKNLRPNTLVRLQLWDTAGAEKYAAVAAPVFRNAGGILAVCDVTNRNSLDSLAQKWLPKAFEHLPTLPLTSVLVICNKSDLLVRDHLSESHGRFTPEEAAKVLDSAGFKECRIIEASALTGENVESAVRLLSSQIIEKFAEVAPPTLGGKSRTAKGNPNEDAVVSSSSAGGATRPKGSGEGANAIVGNAQNTVKESSIGEGNKEGAISSSISTSSDSLTNKNKVSLEESKKPESAETTKDKEHRSKCPC